MDEMVKKRGVFAMIFISPDEPRFRAGWRLMLHSCLFFLIIGILVFAVFAITQNQNLFSFDFFFLSVTLELAAVLIGTWIARRALDRRSFVSLGLKLDTTTLPDLLLGLFIPAILMGLIFLVEWALGWLTFEGFAWQRLGFSEVIAGLLNSLVIFLVVAISEELLSRGYHLQNLTDGLNLFWGLVLSSAIFAVLHLGNPESSLVAVLGLICAGLFLAFGWLRTRQLWLPIGLHLGWNFFEGTIFGFPVSGLETFHLIEHSTSGPVFITGGAFGPEAGLIILPALALGVGLMIVFTRGRAGVHQGLFANQKLTEPPESFPGPHPG